MDWMKDKAVKEIVIGAIVLFLVLVSAQLFANELTLAATSPTREGLYAVFLTNGQVYFGNISGEDDSHIQLSGIFYLQKNEVDPSKVSDAALLKLGNELHGPEDWMEINRGNVLFIEKLRDDGKVGKAILEYRSK